MSKRQQRRLSVHGQTAVNRRSDLISEVVEHAPDAVLVLEIAPPSDEPRIMYANAAFERLYGIPRSQAVGEQLVRVLSQRAPPEDVARTLADLRRGEPFRVLHRRVGLPENPVWLEVNYESKREEHRVMWVAVSRDVTDAVLMQRRSRHLARALDEAQEAIAVSIAREGEWCFEYVNRAFTELLGYEANELIGRSWRSLYAREADLKQISDYRIGLLTGQKVSGDVLMRRKEGTILLVSVSGMPFLADGEESRYSVATLRDVTHSRREERRLREQASLDALTGLCNRREFERLLQKAIEMTPIGERAHVVMFIDLDNFKRINDTEGHDAGDRVLIAVAETLRQSLLPSDDVARWGGDEFAAILYFCAPDQAEARARRVIETLVSTPECRGVGASVGIVRVVAGATIAELMHRADRLVYEAKAAGRNRVMVER